jgi:hypothetical protein
MISLDIFDMHREIYANVVPAISYLDGLLNFYGQRPDSGTTRLS